MIAIAGGLFTIIFLIEYILVGLATAVVAQNKDIVKTSSINAVFGWPVVIIVAALSYVDALPRDADDQSSGGRT